jgi:hypothetical protein
MIGDLPIFFQCSVRLLLVVRKLDVQAVTYWGMVALQPIRVALTRPFQGHSLKHQMTARLKVRRAVVGFMSMTY